MNPCEPRIAEAMVGLREPASAGGAGNWVVSGRTVSGGFPVPTPAQLAAFPIAGFV